VEGDEVDEWLLAGAIGLPSGGGEAVPQEEYNGGSEVRVDLVPASGGCILQFCQDRDGAMWNRCAYSKREAASGSALQAEESQEEEK
jgi:hypothetical protein